MWSTRPRDSGKIFAEDCPPDTVVLPMLVDDVSTGHRSKRSRLGEHVSSTLTSQAPTPSQTSPMIVPVMTGSRLTTLHCNTKQRTSMPSQPLGTEDGKLNLVDGNRLHRAATRQACFASFPSRRVAEGQSLLEQHSVKKATALDYQKRVDDIVEFAFMHQLPYNSVKETELMLLEYLDMFFLDGATIEEAQKAIAAWQWYQPHVGPRANEPLPRVSRALQGWRKLAPPVTRPPMPAIFMALLVQTLVQMHKVREALALTLMFFAYLRPGEALRMKQRDLVRPALANQCWAINLHPSMFQEVSKTQLSDEAIALNSQEIMALGPLLSRLCTGKPDDMLFGIDYRTMKQVFEEALSRSPLQRVRYVLYQARHGGPSHDRRNGARSIPEIRQRGRWTADSSLRRYEAHARLQQEELRERPAVRQAGELALQKLTTTLARGLDRLQEHDLL